MAAVVRVLRIGAPKEEEAVKTFKKIPFLYEILLGRSRGDGSQSLLLFSLLSSIPNFISRPPKVEESELEGGGGRERSQNMRRPPPPPPPIFISQSDRIRKKGEEREGKQLGWADTQTGGVASEKMCNNNSVFFSLFPLPFPFEIDWLNCPVYLNVRF